MNKAKLKHYSTYLPYNTLVRKESAGNEIIIMTVDNIGKIVSNNDKLILNPLSELGKIEIAKMIAELLIDNPDTIALIHTIIQPAAAKYGINNRLPNCAFIWLIERHYDVSGLIEKNKAIDFNTIKL